MSKTSTSGVLWGQCYANGITAADLQDAKGHITGTGCKPPVGHFDPPFTEPDHEYWQQMNTRAMAEIQERRAADMLARGIARSRRSNSEGFGE